jgi:hypothetical protein
MKSVLSAVRVLCFVIMVLLLVVLSAIMPFQFLASPWPIPSFIIARTLLCVAVFISIGVYFWSPWVAVIVSWIDIILVFRGVYPWEGHSRNVFLWQFGWDILFFIAAHVGLLAFVLLQRSKRISTNPALS